MKQWTGIALFFLSSLLKAQEQAAVFGYFESQFTGAVLNGRFEQLQSNKARIDIDRRIQPSVRFQANINAVTYHGKTRWPVLEMLPETVRAEAAVLHMPGIDADPYILLFEDRIVLDNAFIRFSVSKIDITIGKQQLSFGTGYAFNPTDLFNTKDLIDPAYEQPGHNAVRADWMLSPSTRVTAVYSPAEHWELSGKLLEIKTRLGRFDLSLIAAEKAWNTHDYTQMHLDLVSPGFLPVKDRRRMAAVTLAGEFLGLGVWSEAAFHAFRLREDYQDWLIGADYTFRGGSVVMAEYFHSGMGRTNRHAYRLNDWMRYLAGEQKALARDQLYAMALFPAGDVMKIGFSSIYVLSDNSAAVIPMLAWSVAENAELTVYGNVYFGAKEAAFHSGLGSGCMIRGRFYF